MTNCTNEISSYVKTAFSQSVRPEQALWPERCIISLVKSLVIHDWSGNASAEHLFKKNWVHTWSAVVSVNGKRFGSQVCICYKCFPTCTIYHFIPCNISTVKPRNDEISRVQNSHGNEIILDPRRMSIDVHVFHISRRRIVFEKQSCVDEICCKTGWRFAYPFEANSVHKVLKCIFSN